MPHRCTNASCNTVHLSYHSCRNRHCPKCQGHTRSNGLGHGKKNS
ncbi:transposase zinc-binding domain-containing protein [Leeuwenhoekiella polynyae]